MMLNLYILCILAYFIECAAVVCPDGSECADGSSCCFMGTGYGCCPLLKAVCCKDYKHCCPHGYICDVPTDTCFHGSKDGASSQVGMLLRLPARKLQAPANKIPTVQQTLNIFKLGNVVCPDKYSICPTAYTCCLLSSGRYGCCQYNNAVCCSDHIHCCPYNYKCEIPYCKPKEQYVELPIKKLKHIDRQPFLVVIYNICPDHKTNCNSDSKCCPSDDGKSYQCCAYKHGVCCSDGLHCCPESFTCDVTNKKCRRKMENIPMAAKLKAKSIEFVTIPHLINKQVADNKSKNRIQCPVPDETHYCPDNSTCCSDLSGTYSCCPIKNAICCASKIFCCPQNSCCGRHGCGTCSSNDAITENIPGYKKFPMKKYKTCPDNKYGCPSDTTCCLSKSGEYKCCPSGSKCMREHCTRDDGFQYNNHIDAFHIISRGISKEVLKITCADNKTVCKDHDTCCNNVGTHYLCCPFVDAVCCKNSSHCCPKGFTCGGKGICNKDPGISIQRNLADLTCPDRISQCPDNSTCCKLETATYGCCPISKAICCADKKHCCPPGYRCHTSKGYCVKGDKRILAFKYTKQIKKVQSVECPGGILSCLDVDTCCKRPDGIYTCCPLPNAACCADGVGCCPQGYACSGDLCTKGNETMVAMKKYEEISYPHQIVCPDKMSRCKYGSTCCKHEDYGYGCCPLLGAVCCKDKKHCCPHNFICNRAGYCSRGDEIILASTHTKAIQLQVPAKITCPDELSKCWLGQTCCKLYNGTYGCCPMANAVCCADEEHCCPHGYKCFIAFCGHGNLMIPASKPIKAIIEDKVICPGGKSRCPKGYTCSGGSCAPGNDKIVASTYKPMRKQVGKFCPDQLSQCNNNETCCILATGGYGCCPLPEAVCCPDKQHCCPKGYNCEETGFCKPAQLRIPAWKHISAPLVVRSPPNIVCADKTTVCDTGTCCEIDNNVYLCCPLQDGVCCEDDRHCCPTNFKCVPGGLCARKNEIINASSSINGITNKEIKVQKKAHVCPDEGFYCPDNFTCCHRVRTGWGCCPLPNAVCCADDVHCCPGGFSCTKDGKCMKGNILIKASNRFQAIAFPVIVKEHKRYPEKLSKVRKFEKLGITTKQTESLSNRDKFLLDILKNKLKTCPDGKRKCKQYETCCPMSEGYYCCSFYKAVCCEDRCCPSASVCSKKGGDCERYPVPNKYIMFEPSSDPIVNDESL